MWSVKTRPNPGSTSLAARSLSDAGSVARWISNVVQIAPSILSNETPIGLLPACQAPTALADSMSSPASPQNPSPAPTLQHGLWQQRELRYASQIGPFRFGGTEVLIFRSGPIFCNIQTKKCQ